MNYPTTIVRRTLVLCATMVALGCVGFIWMKNQGFSPEQANYLRASKRPAAVEDTTTLPLDLPSLHKKAIPKNAVSGSEEAVSIVTDSISKEGEMEEEKQREFQEEVKEMEGQLEQEERQQMEGQLEQEERQQQQKEDREEKQEQQKEKKQQKRLKRQKSQKIQERQKREKYFVEQGEQEEGNKSQKEAEEMKHQQQQKQAEEGAKVEEAKEKGVVVIQSAQPPAPVPKKERYSAGDQGVGMYYFLDLAAERFKSPDVSYVPVDHADRSTREVKYTMCYDKRFPEGEHFVGVDWTSYQWLGFPPFRELSRDIMNASSTPPTKNMVGWYGNLYSALPGVPEFETRQLLYDIGQENQDIMEIRHSHSFATGKVESVPGMTMVELTKTFSILIDIGGNGYSGRLKLLLFSGRPLLLVDRWYVEWFHHLLVPYVHYIPVDIDLGNLVNQTRWILDNKEETQKIADNAMAFAIENFSEEAFVNRAFYAARNVLDTRPAVAAAGQKAHEAAHSHRLYNDR